MATPAPGPAIPPPDSQLIDPNSDLEAAFFFDEHKGKIIAIVLIALLAIVGFVVWNHLQNEKAKKISAALYSAKSVADWQSLIAKYPGTIAAGNAQLLLADGLRNENKIDEALKVLGDFTSGGSEHPLIAQGWLSYAATLELKGELEKASQTYANIAQQYGATEAAPAALSAQARLARDAKDLTKARTLYENLVQRFPASFWASEAQNEIERLPKAEDAVVVPEEKKEAAPAPAAAEATPVSTP